MASVAAFPDVLTLEELSDYLRLSIDDVREYAVRSMIPGRQLGSEWRFSRRAIEEWLRGPSGKEALLKQAGAFKNDADDLRQLVDAIYRDRGRPEVEDHE